MSSRRGFLQQIATLGAVSAALPPALASPFQNVELGCQTNAWPIRPSDPSTFFAVLNKIAAYGFQGFETGFLNLEAQFASPSETKQKIAATNLQFFGIHIFLANYDPETHIAPAPLYEKVAHGGAALGAQRLILSGAPAVSGGSVNSAALHRKIQALNRAGQYARSVGMRLAAYHNHAPEFQNNAVEILALLRETDPAFVGFLLDAGHAFEAGADVPAFFREHHARIIGLHLRDYKDGQQVPLGRGTFPLAKLADAISAVNWAGWVLLEEERLTGKPGDAAIRPARDKLFEVFRGKS